MEDVHPGHHAGVLFGADHLQRRADHIRVLAGDARDQGVCFAAFHHHRSVVVAVAHGAFGFKQGQAFAFAALKELGGKGLAHGLVGLRARVEDLHLAQLQVVLVHHLLDALGVAQQDGFGNALVDGGFGGLEDFVVLGLGKHHAHGAFACALCNAALELVVAAQAGVQVELVCFPVFDGLLGHTAFDGRFGYSDRNAGDQSWVERFGNDQVASKGDVAHVVRLVHLVGHRFFGEFCQGLDRSQFHGVVDGGGPHIQGSAEDVGEAQYVVHLVRMVRAAGGHDQVLAHAHGRGVWDLGLGVGQGKYDGVVGHGGHHVLVHNARGRKAQEHIGAVHGVCQGRDLAIGGPELLARVEVLAVRGDGALGVEHHNVFLLGPQLHKQVQA